MSSFFSKTIKAGLLVGTLDILAAFLHYFIKTGKSPLNVLPFIASGVLGTRAFSGGNSIKLLGLALHYFIAFTFTIFFFLIFYKLKFFLKNNILIGIMYGAFIWTVMQFVVLPLSRTPKLPFNPVSQIIGACILIICIGLPLSVIAGKTSNIKN